VADAVLHIEGPLLGQGARGAAMLRALPDWFGIEASILTYEREVEALPAFVAFVAERAVGFLATKTHFDGAAEVLVAAVVADLHRRGIGRALLRRAEEHLRGRGVRYLHVKTLGPSHPDQGYAATRAFWEAMGFAPIEELPGLWDPSNPTLLMVKALL
jgi:ribosomal protein S18 acetylase RimI-like enzyme